MCGVPPRITFSKAAKVPVSIACRKVWKADGINQADPILQNALGVGARFVRIARFIAVGRVRRNGNQRFFGRRLDAEGKGLC